MHECVHVSHELFGDPNPLCYEKSFLFRAMENLDVLVR